MGLRKFKPTSTTATSGAAPSALRSALDSSIQAYAQTLVWPRRDVPRRFTWYFLSTKHPSPARELLLCVYSRIIRSHERRALGALPSLFSRSEPASTDSYCSCSLAAVRRGDGRSSSRRWLEFSESKNLTAESHEQRKRMTRAPSPHKNPVSICANDIQNLKLGIGSA